MEIDVDEAVGEMLSGLDGAGMVLVSPQKAALRRLLQLDSNILIYGASGEFPALDEIFDRTDLAVASVTLIGTLGYHRLSEIERHWLEITAMSKSTRTAACSATSTCYVAIRPGFEKPWGRS